MTFLPIVERELRVAARRPGTYRARLLVAVIATLIGSSIFLIEDGMPPQELGTYIFRGLAALSLVYCLAAGRRSTADCLSEEKREGTLGLLFLTDLRGYDVVFGKLAATSLNSFYGLMAVFPVMAIPLLMGGVTNAEFWRMALVLIDTFVFSLALGIFGSAWTRDARNAYAANFGMLLGLILLPAMVAGLLALNSSGATFLPPLLFTCPGYAFYLSFDKPYTADPGYFWWTTGTLFFLAVGCIGLAAKITPGSWQDKPTRRQSKGWGERWKTWNFGPVAGRAAYRKRLLNQNAFLWLTAREQRKTRHVWIFLGLMGLWALGGWLVEGNLWLDAPVTVTLSLIVNVTLKLWITLEAGQRLAEDKKAGAMELLLTTPLEMRDIFRGQVMALRRQFLGPLVVVVISEIILGWNTGKYSSDKPNGWVWVAGIFMLILDIVALSLVSMSLALTAKGPTQALLGTVFRILVIPWLVFFGVMAGMSFWNLLWANQIPSPSTNFLTGLWFFPSLAVDGWFGWLAWRKWQRTFRPVEPSQKPESPSTAAAPKGAETGQPGEPEAERRERHKRGRRTVLLLLLVVAMWYAYRFLFPPPPPADVVALGPTMTELQVIAKPLGVYLLLPDGKLWIWGQPIGTSQGINNRPESLSPHPEKIADNSNWLKIGTCGLHDAGIKQDGSILEWGRFTATPVRFNFTSLEEARRLSGQPGWRQVTPGMNIVTGIREDGSLWCWRSDLVTPQPLPPPSPVAPQRYGATGGTPAPRTNLTVSPGPPSNAAWMRRYAPDSLGTNSTPQIGPFQIGTNADWLQIVSQGSLNLGLRKNGTIWAWGNLPSSKRPTGSGLPEDFPTPVQICAETNWIELTAGIVPLARNRQGELWQPFAQSPNATAAGWVVGQLLATNMLAKGYSLVQGDRTELFAIRADGSLWRTAQELRSFGGATLAPPTASWRKVGKRQDWVWLSSGGNTGFGLTADNTLWVFGRDYGRVKTPDIVTRWRGFHQRLRRMLTPNVAPSRGGGLLLSEIPMSWEPRPLIRMRGTNWQPLPPLPAISPRPGSAGVKAE